MLTGRLVSRVKLRKPPLRVKNLGEIAGKEEEKEGGREKRERRELNNTILVKGHHTRLLIRTSMPKHDNLHL